MITIYYPTDLDLIPDFVKQHLVPNTMCVIVTTLPVPIDQVGHHANIACRQEEEMVDELRGREPKVWDNVKTKEEFLGTHMLSILFH